MSERERLRRLHVENRLAELRAKHGDDIEHGQLPAWLDTYEGLQATMAQEAAQQAESLPTEEETVSEPPAPRPTPRPPQSASDRREVWDR